MTSNDTLCLGDPALDLEHEEFKRLLDDLLDAPALAQRKALDRLRGHARLHFSREDELLNCLGGANAKCHLAEHAAVLHSLDEVHALLDRAPRPELIARLAGELGRWLPEHVQAMDAGLNQARTLQRFGGAPLTLHRTYRREGVQ